jgi:hypothetical protein
VAQPKSYEYRQGGVKYFPLDCFNETFRAVSVQPYSEVIRHNFAEHNMITSLSWLFGAVELVLAVVGNLRRDSLCCGAVDERDRRVHGSGCEPRLGGGHGAGRSLPEGGYRACI